MLEWASPGGLPWKISTIVEKPVESPGLRKNKSLIINIL